VFRVASIENGTRNTKQIIKKEEYIMKRSLLLIALLALALSLTACGGTPAGTVDSASAADAQPAADTVESAPEAEVADEEPAAEPAAETVALNLEFEGALSQKLMLSLGTMELANTENAITAEQAELMLFYWQALTNLTNSGNSATEEVAALLTQIEETFTPAQITAINQMQLTSEYMTAWATENSITMGTGAGAGGGQGQGQGGGGGMDADARATRQAEEGTTGTAGSKENGISAAINNALIAYLESLVQ
jgi:hypothetical protein